MYGVVAGTRGPFTPSHWMELEHQALIYKYMTENIPVPSNLLIPIRKALESARFSSFSGGFLGPNKFGLGTFHLGFSNNTDPEPGRCRRTDGKKWRCSRDAVADQKYCERHMTGAAIVQESLWKACLAIPSLQPLTLQSLHPPPPRLHWLWGLMPAAQLTAQRWRTSCSSRICSLVQPVSLQQLILTGRSQRRKGVCRMQNNSGLSVVSAPIDLKSRESPFFISRQQTSYGGLKTEFGVVTSNALLNPSTKGSSLMSCTSLGSSQALADKETESQHSLHRFMDEWPRNQSDRSSITGPALDMQSDRTQLSISIPMAADFMSSTSSPNNQNVTLSPPLRLSCEYDRIQMGLGVGIVFNEHNSRQSTWIPMPWESSKGGPLGEVLHHTSNSATDSKNSSAHNIMTEGWISSPHMGSSPAGVLQRTTFNSLSNSSAGSSPRADNNKTERTSASNDLTCSTVVHSLPAS